MLNKYLLRVSLFFGIPVLVVISYFVFDPFYVIYNYGEDIFVENGTPDAFTLNRDFVATEFLLEKGMNCSFDSYILGSSRASAFKNKDWKKYLDDTCKVFHYNCDNETLVGIYNKISFLLDQDFEVSHILLIIDHQLLSRNENIRGPRERYHFRQTNKWLKFHYSYLTDYVGTDFFVQYLFYKLTNRKSKWMDKLFQNENEFRRMKYSSTNMEWMFEGDDKSISTNVDSFYDSRIHLFEDIDKRKRKPTKMIFANKEKCLLAENIKSLISENEINLKIVVSPLYDKKRFNINDLKVFQNLFGKKNIYDFSGDNEITSDIRNYYEPSHYRPNVGQLILDSIYCN